MTHTTRPAPDGAGDNRINVELLAKVREKILTTPEAYDQETFGRKEVAAPCGTACCIAGWSLILSGTFTASGLLRQMRERDFNPGDEAQRLLGLETNERSVLFTGIPEDRWPAPFRAAYRACWRNDDYEGMARAAAAYLQHIIDTGRVTD